MPEHQLRVAVVGGDPLARSALASALSASAIVEVPGDAAPDDPAALDGLSADVVLWDPGAGAEAELDGLAGASAAHPVVALALRASDAARALAEGARGVLSRDAEPARLLAALSAVDSGLVVVDEAFAAEIVTRARPRAEPGGEALTAREREVLELMAQGRSNKRIAAELGISEHTVKFHVNAILHKLDADTRTEAVVQAARLGWVFL